jgi:phage-related protein
MVERIYNVFPSLIAQLKAEHPVLKSNSSWNNLTNTFYANTKDVINDVYDRVFSTYDEFFSDFKVWYNRTINLIK